MSSTPQRTMRLPPAPVLPAPSALRSSAALGARVAAAVAGVTTPSLRAGHSGSSSGSGAISSSTASTAAMAAVAAAVVGRRAVDEAPAVAIPPTPNARAEADGAVAADPPAVQASWFPRGAETESCGSSNILRHERRRRAATGSPSDSGCPAASGTAGVEAAVGTVAGAGGAGMSNKVTEEAQSFHAGCAAAATLSAESVLQATPAPLEAAALPGSALEEPPQESDDFYTSSASGTMTGPTLSKGRNHGASPPSDAVQASASKTVAAQPGRSSEAPLFLRMRQAVVGGKRVSGYALTQQLGSSASSSPRSAGAASGDSVPFLKLADGSNVVTNANWLGLRAASPDQAPFTEATTVLAATDATTARAATPAGSPAMSAVSATQEFGGMRQTLLLSQLLRDGTILNHQDASVLSFAERRAHFEKVADEQPSPADWAQLGAIQGDDVAFAASGINANSVCGPIASSSPAGMLPDARAGVALLPPLLLPPSPSAGPVPVALSPQPPLLPISPPALSLSAPEPAATVAAPANAKAAGTNPPGLPPRIWFAGPEGPRPAIRETEIFPLLDSGHDEAQQRRTQQHHQQAQRARSAPPPISPRAIPAPPPLPPPPPHVPSAAHTTQSVGGAERSAAGAVVSRAHSAPSPPPQHQRKSASFVAATAPDVQRRRTPRALGVGDVSRAAVSKMSSSACNSAAGRAWRASNAETRGTPGGTTCRSWHAGSRSNADSALAASATRSRTGSGSCGGGGSRSAGNAPVAHDDANPQPAVQGKAAPQGRQSRTPVARSKKKVAATDGRGKSGEQRASGRASQVSK